MGKLAPSEVDRRGMAVIRDMHAKALRRERLRGFVAATGDDLRLGPVLDGLHPDDQGVLDAWEEFVWRVVSARRTHERGREPRRERDNPRETGEWERGRERTRTYTASAAVPPRGTHRPEDRWVPFSDWLSREPQAGHAGMDEHTDPWMSLHLDPMGSFWRDPWRDGAPGTGRTPPGEGGVAIQREPTPAPGPSAAAAAAAAAGPSRWSPPLPFERRTPGPQFVFDEPPERLTFDDGEPGIQVIDLSRRARENAAASAALAGAGGAGVASGPPRWHRERHGVLLPGARSPSPGPRPTRTPAAGDASRWLDEWSATQPLLGRRARGDPDDDDDFSPSHTLRRVRARIDSARGRERDTRRDGVVFPDHIDLGAELGVTRDRAFGREPSDGVGGEDMRRLGVPAVWAPLDAGDAAPESTAETTGMSSGAPARPPRTEAATPSDPTSTVPPQAPTTADPENGASTSVRGPTDSPTPNPTGTSTPAVANGADTARDRPVARLPRRPVSMLRAD